MGDSSDGQPDCSGMSDLKVLLKKTKERYEKLNPGDERRPCPFCILKCKTRIQCNIHISKEHQSVSRSDKKGFLSQVQKESSEKATNDNKDQCNSQPDNLEKSFRQKLPRNCKNSDNAVDDLPNDLIEFLEIVERDYPEFNESATTYSKSQAEGYFYCHFCPEEKKRPFNTAKGLKIHITKCHPELKDEIVDIETNIDIEDNLLSIFNLKSKIGVLKRIPKSARPLAAKMFAELAKKCVKDNDLVSWEQLLTFSFKACHIPAECKNSIKKRSLASMVKENLSKMTIPHTTKNKFVSAEFYKRVESKVADFDMKGAVKLLCSEDSFAPLNENTINLLKAKHPAPSRPLNLPLPPSDVEDDECFQANPQRVKESIMSFAAGSASGMDGFHPQFFKDLISLSAGNFAVEALSAITNLCNFMLLGKVNDSICKYIYGASLCALYKKGGGIRPIAVGIALRRLVSKPCCAHVRDDLGDYLRPKQIGFGTPQGCEAGVHATRAYAENKKNTMKIILKIDYQNAFNSFERDALLTEVRTVTPSLFKYLWQCYANTTYLSFNSVIIDSLVGAQQGDPTGPLTFCLAIHPIIGKLKSELNLRYLDDGTLGDYADIVLADFVLLIELSKKIGLEINPAKCEIFFCSGEVDDEVVSKFQSVAPGIRVTSKEDLNLLGAPILDEGFNKMSTAISNKIHIMLDRLKNLNAHTAYVLLKHCFAIPKLTYFMRTTPTWKFKTFLSNIDNGLRRALESIMNVSLNETQWLQASLPVKFGGLGIRRFEDISLPAFLSSIHGVSVLVSHILHNPDENLTYIVNDALLEWNSFNINTPETKQYQKKWDSINTERLIIEKLDFTLPLDAARFSALQHKESNAWLNAYPSPNIGTFMDNSTFRICVALRLGCKVCEKYTCSCGSIVHENGIHGLSCPKNTASWFARHAEMNDIIHRSLMSITVPSKLEPLGLSRDDGKRPDGLTLIPWEKGQSMVWDATCIDTVADSYIHQSLVKSGSAAEFAQNRKHGRYSYIKSQNYKFVAFAVETFGPWSSDSINLINKIGKKLIQVTGDRRSKDFLIQRLSLAIQRGNASCVKSILPTTDTLNEIFYL